MNITSDMEDKAEMKQDAIAIVSYYFTQFK
jgi:hypothetical protein